jgi:hypothetical protein
VAPSPAPSPPATTTAPASGPLAGYSIDDSSAATARVVDAGGKKVTIAIAIPPDDTKPYKVVWIDGSSWTEVMTPAATMTLLPFDQQCQPSDGICISDGRTKTELRINYQIGEAGRHLGNAPMVSGYAIGPDTADYYVLFVLHWDDAKHNFVADAPNITTEAKPAPAAR